MKGDRQKQNKLAYLFASSTTRFLPCNFEAISSRMPFPKSLSKTFDLSSYNNPGQRKKPKSEMMRDLYSKDTQTNRFCASLYAKHNEKNF